MSPFSHFASDGEFNDLKKEFDFRDNGSVKINYIYQHSKFITDFQRKIICASCFNSTYLFHGSKLMKSRKY